MNTTENEFNLWCCPHLPRMLLQYTYCPAHNCHTHGFDVDICKLNRVWGTSSESVAISPSNGVLSPPSIADLFKHNPQDHHRKTLVIAYRTYPMVSLYCEVEGSHEPHLGPLPSAVMAPHQGHIEALTTCGSEGEGEVASMTATMCGIPEATPPSSHQ